MPFQKYHMTENVEHCINHWLRVIFLSRQANGDFYCDKTVLFVTQLIYFTIICK